MINSDFFLPPLSFTWKYSVSTHFYFRFLEFTLAQRVLLSHTLLCCARVRIEEGTQLIKINES